MGYLMYDGAGEYELDDRVLAHLKVVVGMKLRRRESFFLTWNNGVEKGSGRISLWISPNIPLVFRFVGSIPPEINAAWVEVLNEQSHTPQGLLLVSEKEALAYHASRK